MAGKGQRELGGCIGRVPPWTGGAKRRSGKGRSRNNNHFDPYIHPNPLLRSSHITIPSPHLKSSLPPDLIFFPLISSPRPPPPSPPLTSPPLLPTHISPSPSPPPSPSPSNLFHGKSIKKRLPKKGKSPVAAELASQREQDDGVFLPNWR